MKVAVLSESPADDAALRALVDALLGIETQPVAFSTPKDRHWQTVLTSVRPALFDLHYKTDADALVLSLDSDLTAPHRQDHDKPQQADPKCRLCQLRTEVQEVQALLRPRRGRGPVKIALGLAVPCIEAWLLVGADAHVTESAWMQGIESHKPPYTTRQLKQRVYGTERPSLALEQEKMLENVRRLVTQRKLEHLETCFPCGFGSLANAVRGW